MSMPFVTTQVDLTNAAAILGSLETGQACLGKNHCHCCRFVSPVS